MTATYDLAFAHDWLLACVPTGSDITAAVQAECLNAEIDYVENPAVISGVVLTDEPLDGDEIVYSGYSTGWLSDTDGRTFAYAVRRQ